MYFIYVARLNVQISGNTRISVKRQRKSRFFLRAFTYNYYKNYFSVQNCNFETVPIRHFDFKLCQKHLFLSWPLERSSCSMPGTANKYVNVALCNLLSSCHIDIRCAAIPHNFNHFSIFPWRCVNDVACSKQLQSIIIASCCSLQRIPSVLIQYLPVFIGTVIHLLQGVPQFSAIINFILSG